MGHRALAVLVVLLGSTAALSFDAPHSFSADYTGTMNGRPSLAGKLYASDYNVRLEIRDLQWNKRGTSIWMIDAKAHTFKALMPEERAYLQLNWVGDWQQRIPDIQLSGGNACAGLEDAKCTSLGPDTVDRHTCTKWELVDHQGKKETLWVDDVLHLPIKVQNEWNTVTLTNIKEGEQDPSLFKLPRGYRKVEFRDGRFVKR